MAIDKDPSIYRDRGTIGSSDELDEYGVWVKSEPQVLRPDVAAAETVDSSIEPSLPNIEDLPDLDIELETASIHEEPVQLEPSESLVPDFSASDVFSVEDSPVADAVFEDIGSLEAEQKPLSEDSFTELSMDDFLDTDSVTAKGADDFGIPIESEPLPSIDSIDEEPLNIDLEFHDEEMPKPAIEENVSIDFASEEPSSIETVSEFDDFLNGLSDSSSPTPPSLSVETMEVGTEKEPALSAPDNFDADIELKLEDETDFSASSGIPDEVSLDLSLSDGIPEIVEEKLEMDEHFDDIEAFGKEMQSSGSRLPPKVDLSTELLMRIADELSSIKTELASLKGELGVLRAAAAAAPTDEPKAEAHEASHGFFDEEDDEKIALTGDELDNILNTADFTEEAGADAGADIDGTLSMESPVDEFLSDRPDIILDEVPAVEKIELESETSAVVEEPLEISELRETGVRPMTTPPEDTSYLETEEELVSIEPLLTEPEHLDLTEAVIEEPDLGGFTLEEPVIEEPSIESINIDLDLGEESLHSEELVPEEVLDVEEILLPSEADEGLEAALPEENFDEEIKLDTELGMELDTDLKEESFEEVIPEGFIVESEPPLSEVAGAEEITEEIETAPIEEVEEAALENIAPAAIPQELPKEPLPANLRGEVKAVLAYMDQLLESLPESKIEEFAKSEYFDTYKKLFEELGLA